MNAQHRWTDTDKTWQPMPLMGHVTWRAPGYPVSCPLKTHSVASRVDGSASEGGRTGGPATANDHLHALRDQSPQSILQKLAIHRSQVARVKSLVKENGQGEPLCSAFKRETQQLNKSSQTNTRVIAFVTAISLWEESHQRTQIVALGAGVEGPAPCPAGTALLFAPLGLKAVEQALELLFSQVYLILQLPLLDDQG